jgi:hypothetical protein
MSARVLRQDIVGASFSVYSAEEIRGLSVKRITNPNTFDAFNQPNAECVSKLTAATILPA